MKLSFVIVTYNVRKYIGRCLESVKTAIDDVRSLVGDAEVIVVDRGSDDGTTVAACDGFPGVTIIDAPGAGYATAANLGAAKAKGEIIVFLAPEVEVQPGGIARIVEQFDTNPACAIAGGAVLSPKGDVLRGASRLPGFISKLVTAAGFDRCVPCLAGDRYLELTTEVEAVSFSYAAVKASAFCKLGRLDERFFADFADTDLCRRARRSLVPAWSVVYIPSARVRAQDNLCFRPEADAADLHGKGVVRARVRSEMLYVWKNFCILTVLANTALEVAVQGVRYAWNIIPLLGTQKQAAHAAMVLCETGQAMLDTQLGTQNPTTPW